MVKFIEMPEHEEEKKSKEKFKIVSLKVKPGVVFTPELVRKYQRVTWHYDNVLDQQNSPLRELL